MIRIKDQEVMRSLLQVPFELILVDILCWIDWYWPEEMVVTCGYRKGDTGVHGTNPCRGTDLRSRAFRMRPEYIESKINEHWEYDFKRPGKTVAWYHESVDKKTGRKKGFHFHIQTHPNTRRRDNG